MKPNRNKGSSITKKMVVAICAAALFMISAISLCVPTAFTETDIEGADPVGDWKNYASSSITVSGNNYQIKSAGDLAYISNLAKNGETFRGKTVLLMNNIDISAHYFRPIGSTDHRFAGTFNGQNYEITGLSIIAQTNDEGLLAYTDTMGSIINLGIINPKLSNGSYLGPFVGHNDGKIENCYTKGGTISGNYCVGGIAGYNSGIISNCYSQTKVYGNDKCGGIVGESMWMGTVSNCYNTGEIEGHDAAGIAGDNGGNVSYCYSISKIVSHMKFGGIASINEGTVSNCYSISSLVLLQGNGGNLIAPGNVTNSHGNSFSINNDGVKTISSYYNMSGSDSLTKLGFNTSNWVSTADNYSGSEYKVYFPQLKAFATNGTATMKEDSKKSVEYALNNVNWLNIHQLPTSLKLVDGKYEIWNQRDLAYFATKVNDGTFSSSSNKFILMADIRLSALVFPSIGSEMRQFNGTFDGNNHIIRDLRNEGSSNDFQGLFRYIGTSGKVMNLGLAGSTITGKDHVGGIAGQNNGSISNCYSASTVTGSNRVGGIVGTNNGTVEICYNTGTISGSDWIGGIVGYNNDKTITKCFNAGTINGDEIVGGIVGSNNGTISYCYNTKTVNGRSYSGGISGRNSKSIGNCYNVGTVTGINNGPISGDGNFTTSSCYWRNTFTNGLDFNDMIGKNAKSNMSGLNNGNWVSTPSVSTSSTARTAYSLQLFVFVDHMNTVMRDASLNGVKNSLTKITPVIPSIAQYTYTVGEKVSSKALPTVKPTGVTGTYTWVNADEVLSAPGTKNISIKFTPTGDSALDYKEITFTVSVKTSMPVQKTTYTYTYGEALSKKTPSETALGSMGGKYEWVDGTIIPKTLGKQTVKMKYTATGYSTITFDVEITVNAPVITHKTEFFTGDKITSGGLIEENTISTLPGRLTWNETVTLSTPGTRAVKVKYTPTTSGYGSVEFTITVKTKDPLVVPTPTFSTYAYTVGDKVSSKSVPTQKPSGVTGNYTWVNGDEVMSSPGTKNIVVKFTPTGNSALSYKECTFEVTANVSMPKQTGTYTYTYGEKLSVRSPAENALGSLGSNYSWSNSNEIPMKLGKQTVKMKYSPSGYSSFTFDVEITVNAPSLTFEKEFFTGDKIVSGELAKTNAVSSIPGSMTWNENVTLSSNGTRNVKVKYTPTATGTSAVEFTIVVKTKAPLTVPTPSFSTYAYTVGDKVSSKSLPTVKPTGVTGTYTWANGDEVLSAPGSKKLTIKFTPTGTSALDYKECTFEITANITMPAQIGKYTITYGEKLSVLTPNEKTLGTMGGKYEWVDKNEIPGKLGKQNVEMKYTATGYATITFTVEITVNAPTITCGEEYFRNTILTAGGLVETNAIGSIPGRLVWAEDTTLSTSGTRSIKVKYVPTVAGFEIVEFNISVIVKTPLTVPKPTIPTYTYTVGETISSRSLPTVKPTGLTGNYSWVDGNTVMNSPGSKKIVVKFTPTGESAKNYMECTFEITANVTMPAQISKYIYAYGEKLSENVPIEKALGTMGGKYEWANGNDIPKKIGEQTVKMRYSPNGYEPFEFDVKITVEKPFLVSDKDYFVGDKLSKGGLIEQNTFRTIPGRLEWSESTTLVEEGPTELNVTYTPTIAGYGAIGLSILVDVEMPEQMTPDIPDAEGYTYTVGDIISTRPLPNVNPAGVEGYYSWVNGNEPISSLYTNTVKIRFTPTGDSVLYFREVVFDVDIVVSMPPQTSQYVYAYGEMLSENIVNENAIENLGGHYEWANGDEVPKTLGKQTAKMIYFPDDYDSFVFDLEIFVEEPFMISDREYIVGNKLFKDGLIGENTFENIPGRLVWTETVIFAAEGTKNVKISYLPYRNGYDPIQFNLRVNVSMFEQTSSYAYEYGEKLSENLPSENVPGTLGGHFEWVNGDEIPKALGKQTVQMRYCPTDFEPIVFDVEVFVKDPVLSAERKFIGDILQTGGEISKNTFPSIPGTLAWTEDLILGTIGTKTVNVTYTPDVPDYEIIEFSIPVETTMPTYNQKYVYTYGEPLLSRIPSGPELGPLGDNYEWAAGGTVPRSLGKQTAVMKYTPEGFEPITFNVEIDVEEPSLVSKHDYFVGDRFYAGDLIGRDFFELIPGDLVWSEMTTFNTTGPRTVRVSYIPSLNGYGAIELDFLTEASMPKQSASYEYVYGEKLSGNDPVEKIPKTLGGYYEWMDENYVPMKLGKQTVQMVYHPEGYKPITFDVEITVNAPYLIFNGRFTIGDILVSGDLIGENSFENIPGLLKWNEDVTFGAVGQRDVRVSYTLALDGHETIEFYILTETSMPEQSSQYVFAYGQMLSASTPSERALGSLGDNYVWDDETRVLKTLGMQTVKMRYLPVGFEPIVFDVEIFVEEPYLTAEQKFVIGDKIVINDLIKKNVFELIPGSLVWAETVIFGAVGQKDVRVSYIPELGSGPTVEFSILTETSMHKQSSEYVYTYGQMLSASAPSERALGSLGGNYIWNDGTSVLKTLGTQTVKMRYLPVGFEPIVFDVEIFVEEAYLTAEQKFVIGDKIVINDLIGMNIFGLIPGSLVWAETVTFGTMGQKDVRVSYIPDLGEDPAVEFNILTETSMPEQSSQYLFTYGQMLSATIPTEKILGSLGGIYAWEDEGRVIDKIGKYTVGMIYYPIGYEPILFNVEINVEKPSLVSESEYLVGDELVMGDLIGENVFEFIPGRLVWSENVTLDAAGSKTLDVSYIPEGDDSETVMVSLILNVSEPAPQIPDTKNEDDTSGDDVTDDSKEEFVPDSDDPEGEQDDSKEEFTPAVNTPAPKKDNTVKLAVICAIIAIGAALGLFYIFRK